MAASLSERVALIGKPLFILFGIVSGGIYWFMNGSPTEAIDKQNATLTVGITKTQQKIKEAEERLANKSKFQEEMERLSQTFRLALEYLPKDLDIQDILKKTALEARS